MKRRLAALAALAALAGLALALVGTTAVAAWLSTGSAQATITATMVNQANAPTATKVGGTVKLEWQASTLANDVPAGGYRVVRHDGSETADVCPAVTSTSCTDPTPVAGAVTYGVIATIGAHWEGVESATTSFKYDDVAPVTTANVSPAPNGANGWNKAPVTGVTVSLAASDPGNPNSGVDHISYQVGTDSPVIVKGSTTSFDVSGEGVHTITYFAEDKAANQEDVRTLTVKIDPHAPVTTLTSPSPVPNWSKDDVTLHFSASDSGTSGLASITAAGTTTSITGAPASATTSRTITAPGMYTVTYFATDTAGNEEGANSVTFGIDKDRPTSSIAPTGSTAWITQPNKSVTITGTDAAGVAGSNSGVASIVYQVDDQAAVTTPSPATFLVDQGDHTITYHAVDLAGNIETDNVASIRVDNVAPTASINPGSSATTWRTSSSATVSATDATSGVASVAYKVNGASSFTTVTGGSATITGLADGSNTIVYRATDKAGNVSGDTTATIKVDTVRPTVSPIGPLDGRSYKGTNGSWGKLCTSSTDGVCATIVDAGGAAASGVDATTVRFALVLNPGTAGARCWDGTTFATGSSCSVLMSYSAGSGYASSPVPSSEMGVGSYSLTYTAKDTAGNSALSSVVTFAITN